MEKEDKQLLFIDLCARLPYGVKVKCGSEILTFNVNWLQMFQYHLDEIKPYLRPMSSMTEEELKMFKQLQVEADEAGTFEGDMLLYDWLNKNHFDYRLLIFQGLALEAPEGMYKTK